MQQKVFVLDVEDSRSSYYLNQHLEAGWIVKFVSEQRVSGGGAAVSSVHGKIVYILETKEI